MASRDLKELFKNLGLVEDQSVFLFSKENGDPKSFAFIAKETEKKLSIIKPTAFYVFNNQPYILFFDLTENDDTEREKEIHKQVWSFDQAPLVFIIKDTGVEIFNAFSYDKKIKRLEKITGAGPEMFSFWKLQSGESWKWLEGTYYKTAHIKRRVNQKLFENIKRTRERLLENGNNLSEDQATIIILRLLFARYLIDRKIKIDADFIPDGNIYEQRAALSNLILKPKELNEFFKYLNGRFNGVLFKDEKLLLTPSAAEYLADIFNADDEPHLFGNDMEFTFSVFDFSIIPVELISGIYESLINEETRGNDSAIYTPSFLVEYILTQTVDKFLKENKTSECKVYDPSCGSGIFLVQAYRRMVDMEKALCGNSVNKIRLREIAVNNLFGTDINKQAINVTCFSIYVALLDYQDPASIRGTFKFPDLVGNNLFGGEDSNFFNTEHSYNKIIKSKELNFIVGNPPWKNGKSDPYHLSYLNNTRLNGKKLIEIVSGYQLAQSFILRSLDFSTRHTQCALIVTSKAIYNNKATGFKKTFLETFNVEQCFDLSAVSTLVFQGAINPAMILIYKDAGGKNTSGNIVKHLTLKSNVFLRYYRTLVIEKTDSKEIKQRFFLEYPWMFKVALYGGVLDYVFLKRLTNNPKTILDLLKDNKSTVSYGDGIKLWTEGAKKKAIENAKKTQNKLPVFKEFIEIKGIPIIESESIADYYTSVDDTNLPAKKDLFIKSGNNIKLYVGERLLFKAIPRYHTDVVVSYMDSNSVFREKTLGISSANNHALLKLIYAYSISNIYTYFQYLTSSWGTFIPEILHNEYLSFPFIEPNTEIKDKLIALVDDFLMPIKAESKSFMKSQTPLVDQKIIRKLNNSINKLYNLSSYEHDLIDYVWKISRYEFQEDKQQTIIRPVRPEDMKAYAKVYTEEFRKIYDKDEIQVDVYPLDHFVAMKFSFNPLKTRDKEQKDPIISTEKDERAVLKFLSKTLTIEQITDCSDREKNLYIQKDIKGFEKDSFYIIKPNEYKCWHRAMAWYDVAEFKEAIQKKELKHLKLEKGAPHGS